MRAPSLDRLEETFLAHWGEERDLRSAVAAVRDAIVHGISRGRARRLAADRRWRRRPGARQALIAATAPVLARAARAAGVDVAQLASDDRSRTVCRARDEAMWALKHVRRMSYPEIATGLGGSDHTRALRGVRRAEARVAADPGLAAKLRRLAAKLRRLAA